MSTLAEWLNARGLGALHGVLEAQEIDLDVLPDLTEDDLKSIGIALGSRRRLLKAITESRSTLSPPVQADAGASVDSAERRQLSVLFVDLVGSTALSAQRDPEEMRRIVRRYQNAVTGEVARFGGYVAKFMGDGVLAYFGWPTAHEDEGERAVRAAMAAVAAVADLRTDDGQALAARAGIATGLVVVGDMIGHGAAQEASVVGDLPNIAARLQDMAKPGQVLIADSTRIFVQSTFDLVALGPRQLKGLEQPLAVFAVRRERSSDSRFEARAGYHLRPMVGRDQELALLCERWAEVQGGDGQCVLLVGEAGIGKSRITRALLDIVAKPGAAVLRFQCSPYHLDSALWPVIQQMTVAVRIAPGDSPGTRLDKIDAFLRPRAAHIKIALPLIASLLGVAYDDDRYGRLNLSPQAQRDQTLATLVELLISLSRRRPVLIVMEDMHWTDPSTLEFIHLVLDHIEVHCILLLLTSRPDGQPLLAGHPHVTRLVLNRLGRAAVEAMTAAIAGSDALPEDVRHEILTRTDGVPLFVEELTRALVEQSGQDAIAGAERSEMHLNVPATLHDSLMSRLDRLPEVKRVAQVAGCIGRNFDYRTLAAIGGMTDAELNASLDRLVDAELVFRRGEPPDATYTFKHALVRDAAANSLLRSEFRRINAAIVMAFEAFAVPPPPERIARHAELAGLDRKAVDYLLQAGRGAIERYANQEAINHLERALRLISGMPEGHERALLELDALAMAGVPRIALHGYAAAEVETTYRRTVELAERAGDKVRLFQALRGLWNCIYDRADLENSRIIAERLCALAVDHPAAEAQGLAYRALGGACISLGQVDDAIEAFEKGLAACAGLEIDAGLHEHGESPLVIGGVYAGFVHTIAGNFDRGQAFIDEALDVARRLQNPLTFAFAHHIAANTQFLLGAPVECARISAESFRVAVEHRLVFWMAAGDLLGGWAEALMNADGAGIQRIRRGLHAWQTSGAELHLPTWNAALADGLLAAGAVDEASEVIDPALALATERKERFAVPLLLRLKGLVADRQGDVQTAETVLEQAVAMARQDGAHLYELRAACDLAGVMARCGDRATARKVLVDAGAAIRGGATVPCVRAAQTLLSSLG